MNPLRLIDMTETYRLLDSVKDPDARVKAAREKILDMILTGVEGWTMFGPITEQPKPE